MKRKKSRGWREPSPGATANQIRRQRMGLFDEYSKYRENNPPVGPRKKMDADKVCGTCGLPNPKSNPYCFCKPNEFEFQRMAITEKPDVEGKPADDE